MGIEKHHTRKLEQLQRSLYGDGSVSIMWEMAERSCHGTLYHEARVVEAWLLNASITFLMDSLSAKPTASVSKNELSFDVKK